MYRSYSVNNMPEPLVHKEIKPAPPETVCEKPHSTEAKTLNKDYKDDIILIVIIFILLMNNCDDKLLLAILGFIFLS